MIQFFVRIFLVFVPIERGHGMCFELFTLSMCDHEFGSYDKVCRQFFFVCLYFYFQVTLRQANMKSFEVEVYINEQAPSQTVLSLFYQLQYTALIAFLLYGLTSFNQYSLIIVFFDSLLILIILIIYFHIKSARQEKDRVMLIL